MRIGLEFCYFDLEALRTGEIPSRYGKTRLITFSEFLGSEKLTQQSCDALVFFGATGDLAHKKMARLSRINCLPSSRAESR
jgi:hypothetical protein